VIDYAALEAGLVAWVKTHAGLDLVVWENASRPFAQKTFGVLAWVSATSQGVAETTYAEVVGAPAGQHNVPTTTDHQVLVVQIAAESPIEQTQPAARAAIESLRVRARTPRALEGLAALGVALASVGPAQRADYLADQRMVQRSLLELRLNAASSYTDTEGGSSTIEHTELVPTNVRNPADVNVDPDLVPSEIVPPLP
jgi:hypothetical protein